MKKILNWMGQKLTYIVENYLLALMLLGGIGILFAIIGHYGRFGFDWKWFVFLHLPLYIFVGWAILRCIKMYKEIENENDRRRI